MQAQRCFLTLSKRSRCFSSMIDPTKTVVTLTTAPKVRYHFQWWLSTFLSSLLFIVCSQLLSAACYCLLSIVSCWVFMCMTTSELEYNIFDLSFNTPLPLSSSSSVPSTLSVLLSSSPSPSSPPYYYHYYRLNLQLKGWCSVIPSLITCWWLTGVWKEVQYNCCHIIVCVCVCVCMCVCAFVYVCVYVCVSACLSMCVCVFLS